MRISHSLLETYKQCPYKYKLLVIDKLQEPKNQDAVFGSFIHLILHWFYNNHPKFMSLEELLAYYEQKWDELRYIDFFTKKETKLDDRYFQDGKLILTNFYNTNKPNGFCDYAVLDLEKRFEVVLQDKKNELHILSGIIDRIDKIDDKGYELIDYKTNKSLPSLAEVTRNPQLNLYALGIKQMWPYIDISQVKFSLYFLKFNEKITINKKEEDLKKVKDSLLKDIEKIQKTKEFNPKPSPLCNWCGFKDRCPVFKEKYQNNDINNTKNQEEIAKLIDQYFGLEDQKRGLERQIKGLKSEIDAYCQANNISRVYGKQGYFTRKSLDEETYDWIKVRELLRPLKKWNKLLTVQKEKLDEVLKEIPEDIRIEIERTKTTKKTTKIIQATHYKDLSPFQNGDVKDNKEGLKLEAEDSLLEA